MLKVRLDNGKELIFLGTTLGRSECLVESAADYRHGRANYADWCPAEQQVMRYGTPISGPPVVLEDLGPLPQVADDFSAGLLSAFWSPRD